MLECKVSSEDISVPQLEALSPHRTYRCHVFSIITTTDMPMWSVSHLDSSIPWRKSVPYLFNGRSPYLD
jgi:hypothetical protein